MMPALTCRAPGRPCGPSAMLRRPRLVRRCSRRARGAPARAAGAAAAVTVVERRAADIIVIGDSVAGCLAAYSAAKAGRKVILLPSFGLDVPAPAPAALQPLKITHTSPLLAHLSVEAAAYWRGLEVVSDCRLLQPCPSLDIVFDPDRDHAGAAAFAALVPAAAAAGARAALLRADQVRERLTSAPLRLPPSASALLQPDAGVLLADAAAGAARALAERAGVVYRERLSLRGWRDAGGAHFRVEASSALLPEALSIFEAERLLLAPSEAGWAPECLQLFGIQSELEVRELVSGGWLAGSDATQLPLWQFWGAGGSGGRGAPGPGGGGEAAPLQPCFGLPMLPGGARVGLGQLTWQGRRVDGGAFAWAAGDGRGAALSLEAAAGACLRGVAAAPEGPDGAGEEDDEGEERAGARGGGGGGRGPAAGRPRRRVRSHLVATCGDGLPVVGSHPGLEPGRLLFCCAAAGGRAPGGGGGRGAGGGGGGGLPPFQLAPVVAKVCADLLLGRAAPPPAHAAAAADGGDDEGAGGDGDEGGSLAAALWAARPAVTARAGWPEGGPAAGPDTLGGLAALQRAAPRSAEAQERADDEASDRRRDEKGSGLLGGGGGGGGRRLSV
ncbi:MAG: hypothetical protein J3K34DRAFT_526476 [Monoraphidium minutum]|nr:MAG: hypothetical protein J3K34DRAFT_526476 [Monoraphidium minutum]